MHRIALVLAIVAMFLAPPGLAQAQLGGPNVPTPLTEPPPPAPVDGDLEDEGLSSLQQILIFVAAGLVLATIAFVILRDARRSAPDAKSPRKSSPGGSGPKPGSGSRSGSGSGASPAPGPRAAAAGGGGAAAAGTSASAERARERQRAKRAKAKAKAARQQRKRNRPH